MDTFFIFLFNMDYILSCRCSPALPCYTVDLVPLTFLLLRIIFSYDLKKLKDQHSVIKRKNKFTELGIDEILRLLGIIFGY